jgi:hypothetical protein
VDRIRKLKISYRPGIPDNLEIVPCIGVSQLPTLY